MAGYIGSKSSVTQVDGYSEAEADAEFVAKSTTGNLTLDVSGILNLDSAFSSGTTGGIIRLKDAGTQFGDLYEDSGNFLIASAQVDKDIIFKGNDGGAIITPMTIDMSAGGKVGIGTSSPDFKLQASGSNTQIGIESTATDQNASLYYTANGAHQWEVGVNITAGASYEIYDRVNNSSRFVVDHSGKVGIGTSSPTQKLRVEGNIQSTGQFYAGSAGAATPDYAFAADTSLGMFRIPGALGFSTGGTERMKIDASGRVTMPYQPAFMAKKTSSQEQSATTNTKITFGDTDVNVGSHYNNTNHRFTAPVAGTYLFAINLRIGAESNLRVLTIALRKNGSELYGRIFGQGAGNDYGSGSYDHPYVSGSTIISLNANDYVEMWTGAEITYSGNLVIQQGNGTSQFMGYLIG